MLDLIRIHEWGNLQVHFRGCPQGAPLALEAEGGQGAVISAATGHASPEQVAMGQQVGGHKRAITVATYSHPATVGNAHFYGFINSGFSAGDNLIYISVVHGVRVANYRHGGVIQNGVSLGEQKEMGDAGDGGKPVNRTSYLPGGIGIVELQRIGPNNGREPLTLLVIWRQVESKGERNAIGPLVSDKLLGNATQLRRGIREVSQRLLLLAASGAQEIIGRLSGAFITGYEARTVIGGQSYDVFKGAISGVK